MGTINHEVVMISKELHKLLSQMAVIEVLIEMKRSGEETPAWDDLDDSVKERVNRRYNALLAKHKAFKN